MVVTPMMLPVVLGVLNAQSAGRMRDNGTVRWMVEGGTPNTLLRRGVTKDSLPIGAEIVVNGFRAKDGSNRANGQDVTFPDGRKLFVTGSAPDAPPEKR